MGKIKRGGYIFVTWVGDHPPKHVHVFRNRKLILKYDLERMKVMEGKASKKLFKIIFNLIDEGLL